MKTDYSDKHWLREYKLPSIFAEFVFVVLAAFCGVMLAVLVLSLARYVA